MKIHLDPVNLPNGYPLLLSTCICCTPTTPVDTLAYSLCDKIAYQGKSYYTPSLSVSYIDLSLEGLK